LLHLSPNQMFFEKALNASTSGAGGVQVFSAGGELHPQGVWDPAVVLVHAVGIGLVVRAWCLPPEKRLPIMIIFC